MPTQNTNDNVAIEIVNDEKRISRDHYSRLTDNSVDAYLTMICLERTFGDAILLRTKAKSLKVYWAASLIVDAVLEKDISLIDEVAKRVDGAVPESDKRDSFANIFGNALEDVMDYPTAEQCIIRAEDKCIIALAKAMVFISLDHPGNNVVKKKDKQKAVNTILNRIGGKKSKPEKIVSTINYVEPEWAKELGDGSNLFMDSGQSMQGLQEPQTKIEE